MEDDLLTLSHEYKLAGETYHTVDRAKFYENFLKERIRPDGRSLFSYRKCVFKDLLSSKLNYNYNYPNTSQLKTHQSSFTLNNNIEYSSIYNISNSIKNVLISSVYLIMGNSRYNCKLIGDLELEDSDTFSIQQFSQNPEKVNANFTVDVTIPKHVVNEVYDSRGPCINISHLVSNFLENVLNSSEIVPKDQISYDLMCSSHSHDFKEDRVVSYVRQHILRWNLNMKISCDEYDGNLLDSCFLCASYCLSHSKLPFVVMVPESNSLYPYVLDSSFLDSKDILELNKWFLYLQCNTFSNNQHYFQDFENMVNYIVQQNFYRPILMKSVPFTLTFCNYENYFLIDPTREDEHLGVNYSVYILKSNPLNNNMKVNSKNDNCNNDYGYDDNHVDSIQPLNIMGHPGLTNETLNKLYEVSWSIVNSLMEDSIDEICKINNTNKNKHTHLTD